MTDDQLVPVCESSSAETIPRRDFAWLSRLIARRTTDALVIVILGVGLLASGGKLIEWWQDDQGPNTHPGSAAQSLLGQSLPWGANGQPIAIDFGSSPYTVQRQTIRGEAAEASQSLLASCRWHSEHAPAPKHAATQRELALLSKLAKQKPIVGNNHWQLHRIDYPTQMFVGVRRCPLPTHMDSAQASGTSTNRVVCWGILFPFADQHWTTFLFHPIYTSGEFDMPQFELPESANPMMSLRSSTAGALTVFSGQGRMTSWQDHFQGWFTEQRGTMIRDWTTENQSCSARFALKHGATPLWIDVLFARTTGNQLRGLIMATRQTSDQQRGNP